MSDRRPDAPRPTALRFPSLSAPSLRAPGFRAPSLRTLGPGSVSSLLKVVLDVAHFALWTALAVLIVGGVGLLLASPFKLSGLEGHIDVDGRATDIQQMLRRTPQAAALIAAVAGYLSALIVIFSRLRRVFETLTVGDPFRPENVARLRQVGLALAVLEALGFAVRMAVAWLAPEERPEVSVSVNLTAWFSILVVFVLAEVFREGARLRGEAELTI